MAQIERKQKNPEPSMNVNEEMLNKKYVENLDLMR